ncbi:hypothetical protein GCM10010274_44220 [Streptomyces lavendofoliae]|uniref:Uncharacterized protein n=1 Tax=Streptomyces lavendofoliae TaxID=67314 RepID=A0A918I174_9ACTN|nr:hypothetical protein GCM10010274_44220 [Streptomyces lavendofoliae]
MSCRRTQGQPRALGDQSDKRSAKPGLDLGWELVKGTFNGVGRVLGQFLAELVRAR